MKKKFTVVFQIIVLAVFAFSVYLAYQWFTQYARETEVLKKIVTRLEADSRVAEVLVTGVNFNEVDQKTYTTIKFLEYDSNGKPMDPKYFNFSGNIIQFQSLVIRFNDDFVRRGDRFKGKSVYLFWKVFMLDGDKTQEYDITKINTVPRGYRLETSPNEVETQFWENFWEFALNPEAARTKGIKSAQIEAPGTMFVPGVLYTIYIEHDGGLRFEAAPLSKILLGERIML